MRRATMTRPAGFTWIDKPLLAAMARPDSPDELEWLRRNGIEVLVSLTEEPLRRDWVDDAGLLVVNVPVEDMDAPTPAQIERCVSTIRRANERNMGVGVHCTAGLGRTGAVLACYYVDKGLSAREAIAKVRELRPGSVETDGQEEAVERYARGRRPKD